MASSQPNMERFLRDWRQDALNKAQYDAAIFIGDKLLALTSMHHHHHHLFSLSWGDLPAEH
jgi:hypothetical protein